MNITELFDTVLQPITDRLTGIEKLLNDLTENHSSANRYLTKEETKKLLNIGSDVTLWKYTRDGQLPMKKIGGKCLFKLEDVQNFVNSH